uniref:N-acetylneuraminate synthase n=1 Tax=Algoriphagus sp. TaxID=1872435 RepID=UPI004047C904
MSNVFFIAEAGVNHNGSLSLAKELVEIAKAAGADAVKFQTFKAEKVVTKTAGKAEYQIANDGGGETQYEMIKKLELSEQDHHELVKHCDLLGIEFMSTPFDMNSIDFLASLGVKRIKIPSGEITNLPFLKKIAALRLETIMSTGMSDMEEIETALDVLLANGLSKKDITILHCNTQYPTPFHDVNLLAMKTIEAKFDVRIGYSDHTNGPEVSVSAVALGAVVIEKHFTKSKTLKGPDHQASMEPGDLFNLVRSIRNIELALGSPEKKVTSSEKANIAIARRSIHISNELKEGNAIRYEDIEIKRPGTGISPMKIGEVVGRVLNKNVGKDHLLTWEDLV